MFDRSFLPRADWEFVLLADTHYMLDSAAVEFESRRHQTARVEAAIRLINALDPAFVVHLGDLVQAFPGSEPFDRAMDEATRQLDRLEADCHVVPGNHDIGDKPDPTMPTGPVSPASLADYHDRFGRSWDRWTVGGIDFVTINSQLLNASLPDAADQRAWLETTLRDRVDAPTFLFSHLPPFLHQPDDPGLGHYDTIDQPARDWLLDLIRETAVTHVFAAHTHFRFHAQIGDAEVHVVPSPAFTRPGFSELFASCPPPERGRDDRPKLGFYLVRIGADGPVIHFIRTGGATAGAVGSGVDRLVTRPTAELPASRFGVSLVHSIVERSVTPATFPSSVQQPVHDDYPLYGCLELGAGAIRLPALAVQQSRQTRRTLQRFRRRGGRVVGTVLSSVAEPYPRESGVDIDRTKRVDPPLDEIEVRLVGDGGPSAAVGEAIRSLQSSASVGLSALTPGRSVPGKQHGRPRTGYPPDDLDSLGSELADLGLSVDHVWCAVGEADPWAVIADAPQPATLEGIDAVDWLLPSTGLGEHAQVDRICRAAFATATRPHSRLFVEPLRSLDRTMDVAPGLLDRQRNPTAAFHAVRCLNTVLYDADRDWQRRDGDGWSGSHRLSIACRGRTVLLVLPAAPAEASTIDLPSGPGADRPRRIDLLGGTVSDGARPGRDVEVHAPTVFLFGSD